MIYTGLTQDEVNKLEAILNEIKIPFVVHINEQQLGSAKQSRAGANVFALEIDDDVLKTIPVSYHGKLERYGIYPHAEVPEELLNPVEEKEEVKATPVATAGGWKKWISWQGVVLIILTILFFKFKLK